MAEKAVGKKVIRVVRGDITDLPVEAFVYDITADCKLSSGYGGAIISRGGKVIQDELAKVGTLPTGEATVTGGGSLKAKHIIHVNGPKFHEPDTKGKLARAVQSALRHADSKGLTTLAFPPIGTGLYQVPLDLSAKVIVETVTEHLKNSTTLEEVLLVGLDAREVKPFEAAVNGGN
jgi:O-acetyl-ADP-ribose deacetylase (regulator of RNase III)